MKTTKWVTTAVLGIAMTPLLWADVLTFQPKVSSGNYHDAFIAADNPNCANCSGAAWGQVSRVTTAWWHERTLLLEFDDINRFIGSVESVTQAVLSLTLYYQVQTTGTPATEPEMQVFRMTNSWVNGANYNSRGGALGSWAMPGGDYDPTVMGALAFPTLPADYSTHNWNITTLVSNWVAGVYPHYGMMVKWTPGQTDFTWEWIWMGSGVSNAVPWWTGWEPKLTIYTIPEPANLLHLTATAFVLWIWLGRGRGRR